MISSECFIFDAHVHVDCRYELTQIRILPCSTTRALIRGHTEGFLSPPLLRCLPSIFNARRVQRSLPSCCVYLQIDRFLPQDWKLNHSRRRFKLQSGASRVFLKYISTIFQSYVSSGIFKGNEHINMHMCRNKCKYAKKRESANVMNRGSRSYFGEREGGRVRPKNKKREQAKKKGNGWS